MTLIRSRRLACLAYAAVTLALTILSPRTAFQQIQPDKQSLESRVDAYIQPYIDTGNFSGSILIARRGKILLSKGYGLANIKDRTPNEPNTAYYLASASRIFTSAAIMLLEQQGKLSVNDPLSKHLPDWPRGDEIIIHHLLTLSAGIPNINTLSGYQTWAQSPQTPASLCKKFRDLPLEFEPGAKSVHSNSNYNVLALLIERLSGSTYGEFLQGELFAPLAMSRTAHDDDSEKASAYRAQGYKPIGHAKLEEDSSIHWSVKTGNASIYSTTEDLYRFDRMLVAASLLNEISVTKLFTEHYPLNGYGWFVQQAEDTTHISIAGRSPGFGSSWQRLVQEDVTAIVLGNIYNGVPRMIASALVLMALDREVAPAPLRAAPPNPDLLAEIVGSYQFGSDFYRANAKISFHEQGGHLFQKSHRGSSWMIPAGEMTFIHRTYWSTLEFKRDKSGDVDRLQYDDFIGMKVE